MCAVVPYRGFESLSLRNKKRRKRDEEPDKRVRKNHERFYTDESLPRRGEVEERMHPSLSEKDKRRKEDEEPEERVRKNLDTSVSKKKIVDVFVSELDGNF